MKKLFVFIVKYIPVIQMAGILLNNLIFGLGAYNFAKVLDFIIGNSIATSILLYICGYIFKFCAWHKLVITANLVNVFLAALDYFVILCPTNFKQLMLYFTTDVIFLSIILIRKFKCKR